MKKIAIITLTLLVSVSLEGCSHILVSPLDNMPPSQLSALPIAQLCSLLNNDIYKYSMNGMEEFDKRNLVDCKDGEVYCINQGYSPRSPGYVLCRNEYNIAVLRYLQRQQEKMEQTRQFAQLMQSSQAQNTQPTTINVYQGYQQPCRGVWCANPYGQRVNRAPAINTAMQSYSNTRMFMQNVTN
jgi:hypothetical protein